MPDFSVKSQTQCYFLLNHCEIINNNNNNDKGLVFVFVFLVLNQWWVHIKEIKTKDSIGGRILLLNVKLFLKQNVFS